MYDSFPEFHDLSHIDIIDTLEAKINTHNPPPLTVADLIKNVQSSSFDTIYRRDTVSAIRRIARMIGASPQSIILEVPSLRDDLTAIRPAAHGITVKTLSNLKWRFTSALEQVGIVDRMPNGIGQNDPGWRNLVASIAANKRRAYGLATFINWCALNGILPNQVSDETVSRFADWILTRTLYAKPKDVIRRVPRIWNEVQKGIPGWPRVRLTEISFKAPSKYIQWVDLDEAFRHDAEHYLAMREKPDVFDEHPDAPRRPLAKRTLQLQREHLRMCASILARNDALKDAITSLEQLVEPEAFKQILRFYHDRAKGRPNSNVISIAKTLLQIARYYVRVSPDHLARLRALAARLPQIPFDLTDKNKALLRLFESDQLRAKLIWLPDKLWARANSELNCAKRMIADAQVAVAIALLLVAPMRPRNLSKLNWQRHFSAPNGRRGKLLLHIPAAELKGRKRELMFELPDNVARLIYQYRETVLSAVGADPDGDLFVTFKGVPKHQSTISLQIGERIEKHLGVRVTPHQFRHLAAMFYLEQHPEDFETVRALLGHAFAKTTLIYAGTSGRRASRAYGNFVTSQREALKLKGLGKRGTRQGREE